MLTATKSLIVEILIYKDNINKSIGRKLMADYSTPIRHKKYLL